MLIIIGLKLLMTQRIICILTKQVLFSLKPFFFFFSFLQQTETNKHTAYQIPAFSLSDPEKAVVKVGEAIGSGFS